jgi:hypothetical protein
MPLPSDPPLRTVQFGHELLTLEQAMERLLTGILRRLPTTLYEQSSAEPTLQRALMTPLAEEMALWLESQTAVVQATLLRHAAGIDLDVLFGDYGLRRYNQRPDALARQVAMEILFRPQGMLHVVALVADLLLDTTHLTLWSGRHQYHTVIAAVRDLTVAYTFWTLTAADGQIWHLFVRRELIILTTVAPPGQDRTPGGRTLRWIRLLDTGDAPWYFTLAPGGVPLLSDGAPDWGAGTTTPFATLDGEGNSWTILVDPDTLGLIPVVTSGVPPQVVLSPNNVFEYCQLDDELGTTWYLLINPGGHETLQTTTPVGGVDVTPPGGPYQWLRFRRLDGSRWAMQPRSTEVLRLLEGSPPGAGIDMPLSLGATDGSRWRWGIGEAGTLVTSDAPPLTYDGASTTAILNDRQATRWFWRVTSAGVLDVSPVLTPGSLPETPLGEVAWVLMPNGLGQLRYVQPDLDGSPLILPYPLLGATWGIPGPLFLRDHTNRVWRSVLSTEDVLSFAAVLPEELPVPTPVINVRDIAEATRHVHSAGAIGPILVT